MNSTSRSTDSPPPSGSSNSSSTAPPQTPAPSNSSSSVPPQSPPPTTPPPSSPPPSPTIPPSSPPPSPPTSPPPSRRKSPPPSHPAPPPPDNSPPPTTSPSSSGTPSPDATPDPPETTPPASPSPPPPEKVSSPPSNSSSPPIKKPRETASPNNRETPPPSDSLLAPLLSTSTSPTSTPSPPFSSSSSTPLISPAPPDYVNETLPTKPLPSFPKGKPPAESTTPSPNATSNVKSTDAGGNKTGGVVAIGVVFGFLAVGLVVLGVWFTRRQKKGWAGSKVGYQLPSPSSQNSDSLFLKHQNLAPSAGSTSGRNCLHSPDGGVGNSKSWFAYEELAEATNGFSSQNLLGEGGFGCVYKGSLVDGREVAVKQLKIGGGQGEREFRAEVETISRIHHRHLVSLVGYCISNDQRLLVYDYVPNNTLYYHLHGQGGPLMDWETRVKVAAGAARGIAYLHEDCHPRIIHRDIKSSNILIDDNFEAQVADFGLAKLALDANTHVTTRVMGTFGYMAPEYAASGKLTEKSDVFSFGVVLLELITGRKPVDTSLPLGDESLVEWARPLLAQALKNEEFNRLADPKLENKFVEEEMFRMMEAAAACVRHLALKRPRMSQVVRALDSINLDVTNGMKPGQSEVFDSMQQSAEIRLFRRMAFGSKEWDSDFFNTQSSWE